MRLILGREIKNLQALTLSVGNQQNDGEESEKVPIEKHPSVRPRYVW